MPISATRELPARPSDATDSMLADVAGVFSLEMNLAVLAVPPWPSSLWCPVTVSGWLALALADSIEAMESPLSVAWYLS